MSSPEAKYAEHEPRGAEKSHALAVALCSHRCLLFVSLLRNPTKRNASDRSESAMRQSYFAHNKREQKQKQRHQPAQSHCSRVRKSSLKNQVASITKMSMDKLLRIGNTHSRTPRPNHGRPSRLAKPSPAPLAKTAIISQSEFHHAACRALKFATTQNQPNPSSAPLAALKTTRRALTESVIVPTSFSRSLLNLRHAHIGFR
jgi:hypothetical protein